MLSGILGNFTVSQALRKFVTLTGNFIANMPTPLRVLAFFFILSTVDCSSQGASCPQNTFHLNDNTCFDIHLDKNVPYSEAQKFCTQRNATLPVIDNEDMLQFLARLHVRQRLGNYWIGMQKHNGQWTYLSDNKTLEYKVGHRELVSKSFYPCAAIFSGDDYNWGPERCDLRLNYICQYAENVHGNGTCYTLSKKAHSFRMAKQACENQGGTLAEIRDNVTQDAIIETIKANKAWLNITQEELNAIPHDTMAFESFWAKALYDNKMGIWKNSTSIYQLPIFQNRPLAPDMKDLQCVTFQKYSNQLRECDSLNRIMCQYNLVNENLAVVVATAAEVLTAETSWTTFSSTTEVIIPITASIASEDRDMTTDTTTLVESNEPIETIDAGYDETEMARLANATLTNQTTIIITSEPSIDWQALAIAAFVLSGCLVFLALTVLFVKCMASRNKAKRVRKKEYRKVVSMREHATRREPHDAVRWSVVKVLDEPKDRLVHENA